MAMSDEERGKRAQGALFVMLGIDIAAFAAFWIVQGVLHNPNLAFAFLIVGALFGAGYYIYEIRKLRVKE